MDDKESAACTSIQLTPARLHLLVAGSIQSDTRTYSKQASRRKQTNFGAARQFAAARGRPIRGDTRAYMRVRRPHIASG